MPKYHEVIIIGAGGAGMMCAIHAGRRGRDVLLLDHSRKLGGKILISGGGRCNFTNTGASPAQYVSRNPHFCKSALSRYPSEKFVEMVRAHGIAYHEKKLGQLFCDHSAQNIVQLLESECETAGARFKLGVSVRAIRRLNGGGTVNGGETPNEGDNGDSGGVSDFIDGDKGGTAQESAARFEIESTDGTYRSHSLIIATGGLSIPKIGATGWGYTVAEQFGLKLIERVPALDGFTFRSEDIALFREMAGVSVDCVIRTLEGGTGKPRGPSFRENLLFTHAGLSGPAALQASLHWYAGDELAINLLPEIPGMPGQTAFDWFVHKKRAGSRSIVRNLLAELLPSRFADRICELEFPSALPLPQVSEKSLEAFCRKLHDWRWLPSGTVGYNKAEVTRGGVDTDELSSKTLEAKKIPGLYFIGEVVDVTGWLGGYNFQWAWASGWAAGQVV